MAPFAPFGPGRRVVAGVSGGADSMALAVLLRGWGEPLAVVVDHGLRPDSAAEAALTAARLGALGIPARVLELGLRPGAGAASRARAARYAALLGVCQTEGRPDLIVGHHAADQAETQALRAAAGSGAAGLAGMPPIGWRGEARLLRPLLETAPERLRATCRVGGMAWVEDPGNRDPATPRGALRLGIRPMAAVAPDIGVRRGVANLALAEELAAQVTLYPGGYASVGRMSAAAWSALVWTVSGRAHPPPLAGVARLAAAGQGTLHGVQVRGGWAFREAVAMEAPIPAVRAAMWDGRFLMCGTVAGGEVGALGADLTVVRERPGPPAAALQALPALRVDGKLCAVPHMAFAAGETCPSVSIVFRPARPLVDSSFTVPGHGTDGGCTWGKGTPCRAETPGSPVGSLGSNDEQFRT